MDAFLAWLGKKLAQFLSKPSPNYERFAVLSQQQLIRALQPGDLLLIEGNSRISTGIKYLTQSTWSHVCLYLGKDSGEHCLIEADLVAGVCKVPLEKYADFNMRICRPVKLSDSDRTKLLDFATERIGLTYDTKNIIDLMRYLIPAPPVPSRYRRSLLAFGSGDPTKAICSTLIAQAFQSIKYPILPREVAVGLGQDSTQEDNRLLQQRHYSHFTPRDFDLSPYFQIVKPTIESDFDYKKINWVD